MTFWKNLKLTFKLIKKFYIKKECSDPFLKLFVFKSKYTIDDVSFVRFEKRGRLYIRAYSDKYKELNNRTINSTRMLLNLCESSNTNFTLCNYCYKPILISSAAVRFEIKKRGSRIVERYRVFCNYDEINKYQKNIIKSHKKERNPKNE